MSSHQAEFRSAIPTTLVHVADTIAAGRFESFGTLGRRDDDLGWSKPIDDLLGSVFARLDWSSGEMRKRCEVAL